MPVSLHQDNVWRIIGAFWLRVLPCTCLVPECLPLSEPLIFVIYTCRSQPSRSLSNIIAHLSSIVVHLWSDLGKASCIRRYIFSQDSCLQIYNLATCSFQCVVAMQCHQLYIRHQLWKMFNGLHHIVQFLQAVTCTTGSTYSYVYRTAADTTCHMISIHKCCSVEAEHWICVCKFNANSNIKFICLCVC